MFQSGRATTSYHQDATTEADKHRRDVHENKRLREVRKAAMFNGTRAQPFRIVVAVEFRLVSVHVFTRHGEIIGPLGAPVTVGGQDTSRLEALALVTGNNANSNHKY